MSARLREAAAIAIILLLRRRRRRKRMMQRSRRRFWVRDILSRRLQQGAYHNLLQEMRLSDPESHFSYLRMSKERFDSLLEQVSSLASILLLDHCILCLCRSLQCSAIVGMIVGIVIRYHQLKDWPSLFVFWQQEILRLVSYCAEES